MRSLITIALLLSTFYCFSQDKSPKDKRSIDGAKVKEGVFKDFKYKKKLSASTRLLLEELISTKKLNDSFYQKLNKSFPIKRLKNGIYIGAIIRVDKGFHTKRLTKKGYLVGTEVAKFVTIQIPLSAKKIKKLARINGVKYIKIDEPVEPALNNARSATNVNKVHYGQNMPKGYTGNDVITGVIDQGFEYAHPIWYDTNSSKYRVNRVWEMNDPGNPPNNFSYGTEIKDTTQIKNGKYDITTNSHGSHVGGISSGGYSGSNQTYKGIAPESDIIFASTSYNTSEIIDGINYIFNQANNANKPAVINLSIGSHYGPHDGTSLFDQFCENLVGNGNILVGAAGNEGNQKIHVEENVSTSNSLFSFVEFPGSSNNTDGKAVIDIWGSKFSDFEVAVNIYNVNDNSYEDATPYVSTATGTTNNYTLTDDDPLFPDDCEVDVTVIESSNSQNSKPHARIEIDHTDQDDSYRYAEIEVQVNNQTTQINAWCNGLSNYSPQFSDQFYNINTDGDTKSTVGEIGGTGDSIITVGAYTTDNYYQDCQGDYNNIPSYETEGEIAPFSSKGPTVDSRTKPEITAPGNIVVSAVSSYDNDANYSCSKDEVIGYLQNQNTNKKWYFATMQGTSMAAPVVSGTIALMLEKNPNLTVRQVEKILTNNAQQDSYTGNQVNNEWGWGKTDAYQAVKNTPCFDTTTINTINDTTICSGDSVKLNTSGGSSYSWNPKNSLSCNNCQNPTATPGKTTTYIVDGITPNGCNVKDTVKVKVGNKPTANAGADAEICKGKNTSLNATGGDSYSWSPNQGLSCTNCQNPKASPSSTTIYEVEVKNNAGCIDTDSVKVKVKQNSSATTGPNVEICEGESKTLNASGGNSYEWAPDKGLSCINCQNPEASPSSTTDYTVTVSNSNGCEDTSKVKVKVNSKPSANAGADKEICEGKSVKLNATGGDTFKWTPDKDLSCINCQSPQASPSTTTSYQVEVQNSEGCKDTDQVKVKVKEKPTANAGADKEICRGQSVDLNATGGTSFTWSPSSDLSCINCQNPTASPDSTTVYTVTAKKSNGCIGKDSLQVVVNDCAGVRNKREIKNLNVYPNPNNGEFIIVFYAKGKEQTTVKVHDMTGQTVLTKPLGYLNGKHKKKIDLTERSEGVYNLQIIRKGEITNQRIIIQ